MNSKLEENENSLGVVNLLSFGVTIAIGVTPE